MGVVDVIGAAYANGMTTRTTQGYGALTEKEKQTLRLIVRGHDAKSVARSLDLSVHTINERLRDARRKLAVSSSREAARLVLDRENTPDFVRDKRIGEAVAVPHGEKGTASIGGARRTHRFAWITIGAALMTLVLAIFALTALPQLTSTSAQDPTASADTPDTAVVESARQFLILLDQGRWDDSYRVSGRAFQKLNTRQVWASVSEKVRPPLGAVITRTLMSQENLPAPPLGYEVVKFRTTFANKAAAVETVTLDREDGAWRVVGITVG